MNWQSIPNFRLDYFLLTYYSQDKTMLKANDTFLDFMVLYRTLELFFIKSSLVSKHLRAQLWECIKRISISFVLTYCFIADKYQKDFQVELAKKMFLDVWPYKSLIDLLTVKIMFSKQIYLNLYHIIKSVFNLKSLKIYPLITKNMSPTVTYSHLQSPTVIYSHLQSPTVTYSHLPIGSPMLT